MECKFCKAEMDENEKNCPVCGKFQEDEAEEQVTAETEEETTEETEDEFEDEFEEEETPKKKINLWQLALVSIGGLVLTTVLVLAVLYGLGKFGKSADPQTPGDGNSQSAGNNAANNGSQSAGKKHEGKASYTADLETVTAQKDTVVATMGEYTLTNNELQVYYWLSVEEYGYYLSMMGFDSSKPYDQQIYDAQTGKTFQQLFLEIAVDEWYKYTTLVDLSEQKGFQLTEDQQEYLDTLKDQMQELAEQEGFADIEAFFKESSFRNCTVDDYINYYKTYCKAMWYYDSLYETIYPTQEEIEAYFAANEATLKTEGITKDLGNYYNVRHILISPTGGTKDDKGQTVYTEAEWEACRVAAQKLLDEYLAGDKTEDAFAKLAIEHSEDSGSAESGGMYSQLTKDTNFVDEFKNWYLDESRKQGDTGLVKSIYGYHIMYFSDVMPIWEYEVGGIILGDNTTQILKDAQKDRPMNVDYEKILIADKVETN